jgi:hypothetical protein
MQWHGPLNQPKEGKPMIAAMKNLFQTHPQSVDETYFEHMAFAGRFSGKLFLAAGAALVHAILPFMFEKTASRMIAQMYAKTHNRGQ